MVVDCDCFEVEKQSNLGQEKETRSTRDPLPIADVGEKIFISMVAFSLLSASIDDVIFGFRAIYVRRTEGSGRAPKNLGVALGSRY